MGSYMQMGHHTENLVGKEGLEDYTGVILSPVNREPTDLPRDVDQFRDAGAESVFLDPQLYVPRSERGYLPQYPYFPTDFDSADLASRKWWTSVIKALTDYAKRLGVDAIASPAILPRSWDEDYYSLCSELAKLSTTGMGDNGVPVWQTVMLNLSEMGSANRPQRVTSVVSRGNPVGYYVVVVCDVEPRRELADYQGLAGVLHTVHLLESTGAPVLVAYSSSDMLLYKAAGATHCATGKFFNLRRFTRSRFDEPSEGGGQLAYWFEHSLLAFLRESDILLLRRRGRSNLLGNGHSSNIWAERILEAVTGEEREAWVALGWRHYLCWFCRTESDVEGNPTIIDRWLSDAEKAWVDLQDQDILLADPRNDGSWLRPWRQSISEYRHLIGTSL